MALYKSHRQQVLQNYFDSKDVRTRENTVSIDGQLLGCAACALDDANLRYARELKSLQLSYCPTNIDNNGIYYSTSLDPNYAVASDATQLNSLVGTNHSGSNITINPYDDTLPVPAGYILDSKRTAIKVLNPLLTSFTGSGDNQTGDYLIFDNLINQTIPITNRLSFWLDNTFHNSLLVQIAVYGTKFPQNPWNISVTNEVEMVTITSEGYASTIAAWVYISHIEVRGIPPGGILKCYSIDFNLPAAPDSQRPVCLAGFRSQTFDRYWQVSSSENLLEEVYQLDSLSGLVYQQSYNLSSPISCVTIEPNTWGGVLAGGTTLYYFDVREPMPDLSATALTAAPDYGLDVFYDVSLSGSSRNIIIRPIPYNFTTTIIQYRIIVKQPNGVSVVILSDGSYVNYSGNAGWQSGAPETLTMLLDQVGTYQITLQCLDTDNKVTSDVFPYINFDMSAIVKGSYDLSNLVVNIEGIAYDFLGSLWIYDGVWATPIIPYYNGYILDPIGRIIYMTDKWESVTYS
jgi:hypothetical protein